MARKRKICGASAWLCCLGFVTVLVATAGGLLYGVLTPGTLANNEYMALFKFPGSERFKILRDFVDQMNQSVAQWPADLEPVNYDVSRQQIALRDTREQMDTSMNESKLALRGSLAKSIHAEASVETAPMRGSLSSSASVEADPMRLTGVAVQGAPQTSNTEARNVKSELCVHEDLIRYWKNVPDDEKWVSPFAPPQGAPHKYVTFEPDHAQWNNKRMAFETVAVFAAAVGRTLVLPPTGRDLDFAEILQLEGMRRKAFRIITLKEYLDELPSGVSKPPASLVKELDSKGSNSRAAVPWLRKNGYQPPFSPNNNFLAFPSEPNGKLDMKDKRMRPFLKRGRTPVPVDEKMITSPVIHLTAQEPYRLLTQFYAFIYFGSAKMDRYYKRLVRDSLRYRDAIVCKAALIASMLRKEGNGKYHAAHIRRNDFALQYKAAIVSPDTILAAFKSQIKPGELIYISTDERQHSFFDPIKRVYEVRFLSDYEKKAGLSSLDSRMMPMLEIVIASGGEKAFGTWWSTFTGHIFRLRGYTGKDTQSWFLMPEFRNEMTRWQDFEGPAWWREFPTAWTDIDEKSRRLRL